MATYNEAVKHRKNAVERYRYYRRKNDVLDTYDTSSHIIPTVEKGMDADYYDYMVDLFDSFSPEDLQEIIEEQYFEPEDETSPYDMTYFEEFSDRLHVVDDYIGDQFDNMINYISDYTSFTPSEIDDILSECEEYISEIEEKYNEYDQPNSGKTQNNSQHASMRILNKMQREMFHVY